MKTVPSARLEELAASAPSGTQADRGRPPSKGGGRPFDLDTWIPDYGLIVKIEKRGSNGDRRIVLEVCPFSADHGGGSAVITESVAGQIGFKCHHNSCEGKVGAT